MTKVPGEHTGWKKVEVQGPPRPGGRGVANLRPFPLVTTIFIVNFAVVLNNVPPVRHFRNGSRVEIVICPKYPQITGNRKWGVQDGGYRLFLGL